MFRLCVAAVTSLALASCSAFDPTPRPLSCTEAMGAAAADGGATHDGLENLYQAIRSCQSIEAWEAAWNQHRDSWAFTADSRTVLTNACFYASEVIDEALCQAARGVE